ncbi:MAG: alpha/beta hydrolase family protein [Myxococcota bacterium]
MTTVLFVHGLESGPRGRKALALEQAGFQVVAAKMPCSRRDVLADPVTLAVLAFAALAVAAFVAKLGALGFVLGVMSVFLAQRFVRPQLTRRVFRRSVAVQAQLLAREKVDVVVGSSFGGAVALELLRTAKWAGPTVLLCPAQRRVAARAWWPSPTLPATASRVLVVHARQDETVPLADSHLLVKGTAAALLEVDDDHRLSATATPENLRAWVERVMAPM